MKAYLFLFLLFLPFDFAKANQATFNGISTYTNFARPDKSKTNLVFIHGALGSQKTFNKYYNDPKFNNRFNMLAIDRPGYGGSTNFTSDTQPDIAAQAFLIAGALKSAFGDLSEMTLVGHSYGAPLAVLVAKQLGGNVKNLILISGFYSSKIKVVRWYNTMANVWPFTSILPKFIKTSNEEILKVSKTLDLALPVALYNFMGKVFLIHGQTDGVVPFEHSKWAHGLRLKYKRKSLLYPLDGGYFILRTQSDKIKEIILESL